MRRKLAVVLSGLVVAMTLIISGAPAQANTTEGAVAGKDAVRDDFDDEGVTDYNSHRYSMATGLWQAILWADGAIESDGTTFDLSDIDCDFGPNTTAATRNWQSTRGLSKDGSAGPKTWGKAGQDNLRLGALIEADQYYVNYMGKLHVLTLVRNGTHSGPANYKYFSPYTLRFMTYGNVSGCSYRDFVG